MEVSLPEPATAEARDEPAGTRRRRNPFERILWAGAVVLLAVFLAGAWLILAPITTLSDQSCFTENCPVPLGVILSQASYVLAPGALTGAIVCAAAAIAVRAVRHDQLSLAAEVSAASDAAVAPRPEAAPDATGATGAGEPSWTESAAAQRRGTRRDDPRDYTAYMRPAEQTRAYMRPSGETHVGPSAP